MTDEKSLRLPPNDKSAEMSVLGAMLRDNAIIPEVLKLVRASSFYQYAHALIFDAIVELVIVRATPADPVTLYNVLVEDSSLVDMGGAGYIAEIWESATTSHAIEHAEIIRGCAIKRALARVTSEISEMAMEAGADWKQVLDEAEKRIMTISAKVRTASVTHFATRVTEMLEQMDERKGRDQDKLVMTQIRAVDAVLEGIDEGNLVIIGARTGIGKTVMALNLAFNLAEQALPVLFVSLEQPGIELAQRVISANSAVECHLIRKARITPALEASFFEAVDKVKRAPVWISDEPNQTVLDIVASIRQVVHKYGVGAVFIDYLQLITPEDKRISRHEQVGEITRQLKLAARETKVRIFLLAQISRESEKGADKRPQMHHLRESGSIEQDADIVLLLHRPDKTSSDMEIIIPKNRHGVEGQVDVHFDRNRLKIMDRV